MKSPLASGVFWITLFQEVLSASLADFLAWPKGFWLYLPLKFLLIFLKILLTLFLAKIKIHNFLQIFDL